MCVHAEASSEALQREFFAKAAMLMIDKGGDQRVRGWGWGRGADESSSEARPASESKRVERPTWACLPLYVHSFCFSSVTRQYTCNNTGEESCHSTPQSGKTAHSSVFDRTRWRSWGGAGWGILGQESETLSCGAVVTRLTLGDATGLWLYSSKTCFFSSKATFMLAHSDK